MAGKFPAGPEYNIEQDTVSAKYTFEHFPKPIIFTGFEIGVKIRSGKPLINNDSIRYSPVKDVYRVCMTAPGGDAEGRMSWDQTAVLVAIRGHKPWYSTKAGKILIDDKGNNNWDEKGKIHTYLVEHAPISDISGIINDLMMHQPAKR